jgi:hypothetical protein
MVTKVVKIKTVGWGLEDITLEAISAGATYSIILSLEAILISYNLISRNYFPKINSLRLGIKD